MLSDILQTQTLGNETNRIKYKNVFHPKTHRTLWVRVLTLWVRVLTLDPHHEGPGPSGERADDPTGSRGAGDQELRWCIHQNHGWCWLTGPSDLHLVFSWFETIFSDQSSFTGANIQKYLFSRYPTWSTLPLSLCLTSQAPHYFLAHGFCVALSGCAAVPSREDRAWPRGSWWGRWAAWALGSQGENTCIYNVIMVYNGLETPLMADCDRLKCILCIGGLASQWPSRSLSWNMQSNATCLSRVAKSAWPSLPNPTIVFFLCRWLTELRCSEAACAHGIIHKVLRSQKAREHFIWRCQLLACVLLRDAEVYAPDPRTFWYLTWMRLWLCWFMNVCLHTPAKQWIWLYVRVVSRCQPLHDHISGEITLGNLHAVFASIDDETGSNLSKSRYKKDKRDWASKDFHLKTSIFFVALSFLVC